MEPIFDTSRVGLLAVAAGATPSTIAPWLVDVALKGFLLTAAAWLSAVCVRRRSAATLHRVWTLGLAGCLLVPAISTLAPTWGLKIVPPTAANDTRTDSRASIQDGGQFQPSRPATQATQDLGPVARKRPATLPAVHEKTLTFAETPEQARPIAVNVARADAAGANAINDFATATGTVAIVAGWAAVALAIAARQVMHHLALARLIRACDVLEQLEWQVALEAASRRLGLSRRVKILIHRENMSPMTAGVLRPVIVLPAAAVSWAAAQRDSVLLHELAHVRRHDVLTQLVAGLACAVYWFNPLCWIGLSQMRRSRELACDDLVLAGGQKPADYAGVLLGVAKSYRHRRLACAVGMARESNVEQRIMAILDSARNRMPLSRRAAIGLVAAAAAVVLLVGSMRLETRAEPAPPQAAQAADADKAEEKKLDRDRGAEWTMEVLVTDEQDTPLPGARVHLGLWPKDPSVRSRYPNRDFFADEQGVARIKLPRGINILRLWPHVAGYVPEFVNFAEGTHDEGKLIPDRYHFQLARGTTLSGTVVGESGAPIAGVKVDVRVELNEPAWGPQPDPIISTWLTDSDFQDGSAITDENGRWSIANAPASADARDFDFQLKLQHDDYVRDSHWGELQRAQGVTTAMLRDGSARIVLNRGVPITGTVVDESGVPVAKGLVIWDDDPYLAMGVNEAPIDESGKFQTIPLPPRKYPITVVAPGFQPDQQMVTVSQGLAPLEFKLKPGKRLAMRIVNRSGQPIPHAYIQIGDWRGTKAIYNHDHPNVLPSGVPRNADDQGLYAWDWAPEDAVAYNISALGYAPVNVTLVANGDEHRVELAPKLTFSGRVTDVRSGRPIPEFRVIPVTVFRPQFYSVRIDDAAMGGEGRYSIEIQTFGEQDYSYVVRVEAAGYRSAMSETSYGVGEGSVVQDFALEPAAAREGVVVGPDGQPVEGAAVVYGTPSIVPMMQDGDLEWNGSGQRVKTSSDGKFAIAATWEPMRVRATHRLGVAEILRSPDEPLGRLTLQPWAKLSGQLVQDGLPVAGQNISFFPLPDRGLGEARFQDSYQTQTDPHGRFTFERVPPGPANVRAYLGPWRDSPLTSSELLPLVLTPGEQRAITLGGNGVAISGKVVATGRGETPLDRNWSLNYLVSRDDGVELNEPARVDFDANGPIQTDWLADPGFSDWLATRRSYFVKLSPDGDLRIGGVPAGRYDLVLQLYEQPAGCLVQTVGERVVAVDVTDADVAAGEKSLGQIEVACRVGPRVGENMQVYAFVDPSGRQRTIADLQGRFVLIHVWATWCQPCMESLPALHAATRQLAEAPVTFVGLNIDADGAQARAVAQRRGWNWSQSYLGDKSDMARQLAVSSAPAYFLIGPDGTLIASSAEWSEINRTLEQLIDAEVAEKE